MLSIGPWLLSGSLNLSTFYNSNIYSFPTNRLSGPGFDFQPNLLAELNNGIWNTRLYGSFDSDVYPTLNSQNNTFNPKAGVVQTYSPLPDLTFTTEGDFAHSTLAPAVINALPNPVTSPANPGPTGAAAVVANQPVVLSPNDTFTALASVSKVFNRASLTISSTLSKTEYESSANQDYEVGSLNAGGGIWISPWFYAFANASDANTVPVVGQISNSYSARGGIGSDQIGLFQGSVYYGQQGSAVDGGGIAGGDIYGGVLSFFPSDSWTMSLSVDRVRNRSDITGSNALGLGGLPLSGVPVLTSGSTQNTSIAYRSSYTLSPQTSIFLVLSDTQTAYLDMPLVNTTWLATTGINYQMWTDLSLSLTYSFTRYLSEQPMTSYTQNVVTLGGHYKF